MECVRPLDGILLARFVEPLPGVLADGLEHLDARVLRICSGRTQQALVDQLP